MAKEKKVNYKKLISEICKYGKRLRPQDGLFIIKDGKILSARNQVEKDPPGAYVVELKTDNHKEMLKYLGNLINGIALNKAVTGTGCVVDLNEDEENVVIASKGGEWYTNEVFSEDLYNEIIRTCNSYIPLFEKDNCETHELNLDDIDTAKGKFTLDLSKMFESINSYMLVTNKMLKNMDKDTINIAISVNKEPKTIEGSNEKILKIVKLEIDNVLFRTTCYHALIDKSSTIE